MPTEFRPLSGTERAHLHARAVDPRPFASFLALAWGMAVATLFAAFLVLAVPLAFAGVDFGAWPVRDLAVLGAAIVFAFWTAIALRDHRRHRARRAPLEAALHADLAEGAAAVEPCRAAAVIRVTRVEQGERAYFVRLVDGRVLFVGYWLPADGAPPDGPEADGFPSTVFEVARGPRSGLLLGVVGSGAPLAPEDAFESGPHPPAPLPEVGAWVTTPWAEIRATYG